MSIISELQKITPEKSLEQFQLLTTIDLFAKLAEMSCLSLDMRFKKPLINQRLKRLREDVKFIQDELKRDRKFGFQVIDEEYVEDATCELHEMIKLAIMFGKEGIAAFNGSLRDVLDEAKRKKEEAA